MYQAFSQSVINQLANRMVGAGMLMVVALASGCASQSVEQVPASSKYRGTQFQSIELAQYGKAGEYASLIIQRDGQVETQSASTYQKAVLPTVKRKKAKNSAALFNNLWKRFKETGVRSSDAWVAPRPTAGTSNYLILHAEGEVWSVMLSNNTRDQQSLAYDDIVRSINESVGNPQPMWPISDFRP